ncbi:hypothetical protein [Microtetraspora malaysiensis]|uniref:Uncharacterized protein n=1 Tax=Microtetraspora malaysiensis TaxID=161358 RepID=A0ABW6T0R1_9ACTN
MTIVMGAAIAFPEERQWLGRKRNALHFDLFADKVPLVYFGW